MSSTALCLSCLIFVKIHISNLSSQWIKQQVHMPKDQILCTSGVLSHKVSRDHLCVAWICSDLQGIFSKFLLSPAAKGWFVFCKLCSCFLLFAWSILMRGDYFKNANLIVTTVLLGWQIKEATWPKLCYSQREIKNKVMLTNSRLKMHHGQWRQNRRGERCPRWQHSLDTTVLLIFFSKGLTALQHLS